VLDRNNPISAPQSNQIIRPELQPIRAISPAVSDFRQGTISAGPRPKPPEVTQRDDYRAAFGEMPDDSWKTM
jgi:hypothetical protein